MNNVPGSAINEAVGVAQKSLDHSIDALAHIVLFEPSLRTFTKMMPGSFGGKLLVRALLSEFLTVSARTSVPSGVGGGRSDHQQRQKYLVLVLVRPGFSHKRAPIRQDAWKIGFG